MDSIDFSHYQNIVALTGAGISVASGLRPFRGPGGIWDEVDIERYGTHEAMLTDPRGPWRLFGPMRELLKTIQPNRAHTALADLEARLSPGQTFTLITQNIDSLHQRAGSRNVIEYHGTVQRTRCSNERCKLEPFEDGDPHREEVPACPLCGSPLRLDIVLFNELIPSSAAQASTRALQACDLFLSIGTSGTVYPAAGFVQVAAYAGARTIYVNLEGMRPRNPYFQEEYLGKAEELLPRLFGLVGG